MANTRNIFDILKMGTSAVVSLTGLGIVIASINEI